MATRDDGVTLDVTAKAAIKLADSKFCRLSKNVIIAARRRAKRTLDVDFRGPECLGHDRRKRRHGRSADQLSARRDAGLHARRLQHGQLPRRSPRQGRLPPLAVWLRSRRATTIASLARSARAASTWPCPRKPADRKVDRRGAAHGRQAVRGGQRILPDAAPLAGSRRRRTTPSRRRPVVGRRSLSADAPCSKAKGPRSNSSPGPRTPTAPTAMSRAWPRS